MNAVELPNGSVPGPGTVTLTDWAMMPDGETYLNVWAQRWEILTDKAIAQTLDGFKSAEHWTLAAVVNNKIVLLIPGCRVRIWCLAASAKKKNIYEVV